MNDVHQLAPLLKQCRQGNPAALNDLLQKLRPYVRLLLRSRIDPQLAQRLDSSDLVQETLLRICQGLERFAGEDVPHLVAWVGTIANRVVANCARYHSAECRDISQERSGASFMEREVCSPTAQAERAEEAARLAAALERLPASYREVIEARFFEQRPFAEIARGVGKSVGAVRILCLRALARFRQELEVES